MGNIFIADDDSDPSQWLNMSNGTTDVFFDVLTLAACTRAATPWQRHLALRFADGNRFGIGIGGFALTQLPWTSGWPGEHAFFTEVVALAAERYRWQQLTYDPAFIGTRLRDYGNLLAGFAPVPDPGTAAEWAAEPEARLLRRCVRHDVYEGDTGCRFCGPAQ